MAERAKTSFAWRLEGHLDRRLEPGFQTTQAIVECLEANLPKLTIELRQFPVKMGADDLCQWAVIASANGAPPKLARDSLKEVAGHLADLETVHKEKIYDDPKDLLRSGFHWKPRNIRVFRQAPALTPDLGREKPD